MVASPPGFVIEKANVEEGPFELCETASEFVAPYPLSVGLTILGRLLLALHKWYSMLSNNVK